MITGGRASMYDVAGFEAGLRSAIRGVVRVERVVEGAGGFSSYCTGWLITDELVLVPDFVAPHSEPSMYGCHQGDRAIPASVVLSGGLTGAGAGPALLRMADPLTGQSLVISQDTVGERETVFLVHHPDGRSAPFLSFGRVLAADDSTLRHDADTSPGSSGAPVLNGQWAVIGMHMAVDFSETINEALTLANILVALQQSSAWDEIAEHHRLATIPSWPTVPDPTPTPTPPTPEDDNLIAAAVRWSFDPDEFPVETAEQLRSLVVEPSSRRWILSSDTRSAALQSAGSLEALREARGEEPSGHPGQRVIDRILDGPPYSLDDVREAELPYWLQATRWFADAIPSLPTPAEVNRTLARRRARSRLEQIGGADFRGRVDELEKLRRWYGEAKPGPMVVTGIGGVGKSALVARLALELPPETLLLWLDFDRADVAPDDPPSVLRVLFDQLTVRLEDFAAPSVDAASWPEALSALGTGLASHLHDARPPLIVLDGFEIAQHVQQHRDIWQLLDKLFGYVPAMRVLVAGRAPIADLTLAGRRADEVPLEGLAEPEATLWLRESGVDDEDVIARVIEITHAVPLSLQLAVRYIQAGGTVGDLPEALPERLIDGFLYQRILDRVIDPELKPVARDALVLRRLTPDLIPVVLHDSSMDAVDGGTLFDRLSQEMALVGHEAEEVELSDLSVALAGTGILRLRPELRAATLRLLEIDDRERVRTIDRRAADWYASQDLSNPANAAELVYHLLRLGDRDGAALAWRDECAPFLLHADEELPEDAADGRAWLRERISGRLEVVDSLTVWEQDAYNRIRDLLVRGIVSSVPSVLGERLDRSPASPLVLYDGWVRWLAGDLAGARQVLETAPAAGGPIARDRAVLAAKLAAVAGARREADAHLAEVAAVEQWRDRSEPEIDALTIAAARVGLTVDLDSELELADAVNSGQAYPELGRILTPSDLVLPFLANRIGRTTAWESTRSMLFIPQDVGELADFASNLDYLRWSSTPFAASVPVVEPGPSELDPRDAWHAADLQLAERLLQRAGETLPKQLETALEVVLLGWRRWKLVTTGLFLSQACEVATRFSELAEPRRLSIVGALAVFVTNSRGPFTLADRRSGALFGVVQSVAKLPTPNPAPPPSMRHAELTARVLDLHGDQRGAAALRGGAYLPSERHGAPELENLAFHLLSPDPLEVAVRQVAGIPDTFVFS